MTDLISPVTSDQSPLEVELDYQVRALLVQIAAEERLATGAGLSNDRVYAWPSWSMDTGLSEAQERFVEAWSPARVLGALRSERRVLQELLHWTRVHRDDVHVDEALTIVNALRAGHPR